MGEAEGLRALLAESVECGGGAVMEIVDPRSFEDGGLEWILRYGDPASVRFVAASVIASYDYLCSAEITMAEAVRRLRIMRRVRAVLAQTEPPPARGGGSADGATLSGRGGDGREGRGS